MQPLRILEHAAPVFSYKLVVAEAGVIHSGFVWPDDFLGGGWASSGTTFELSFSDVLSIWMVVWMSSRSEVAKWRLCDSEIPSFPVVGKPLEEAMFPRASLGHAHLWGMVTADTSQGEKAASTLVLSVPRMRDAGLLGWAWLLGVGSIRQVTTPALVTPTRISSELCFLVCVCVPVCSAVSDSLRAPGL